MTENTVRKEIKENREHENTNYVMEVASSDLMHYVLQGLQPPTTIEVPVTKLGDLRVLRTVIAPVSQLS